MAHLSVQMLLCAFQTLHHPTGLFQSLQHHTVLYALLQDAMYAAVGSAYLA